ncbi:hypothetical protein AAHC03_026770 [Spirometra sp. Aus1]
MFNCRLWLCGYFLLIISCLCFLSAGKHYCTTCDDNAGGCMPEAQVNETCEEDSEACTVELFFTPESHNAFVFRSRCGPPSHCPARYTELMCTPFMDKIQTCRICCFENNCHDPTPASPLRLKIMKRLLIDVGKNPAQVEYDINRANMFARSLSANIMTSTRVPTTPEPFSTAGERRMMLRTRRPASVEDPVINTPRPVRTTTEIITKYTPEPPTPSRENPPEGWGTENCLMGLGTTFQYSSPVTKDQDRQEVTVNTTAAVRLSVTACISMLFLVFTQFYVLP